MMPENKQSNRVNLTISNKQLFMCDSNESDDNNQKITYVNDSITVEKL